MWYTSHGLMSEADIRETCEDYDMDPAEFMRASNRATCADCGADLDEHGACNDGCDD